MKRSQSIKFKAIFLLVVFTLNTAVIFACAVGLEMGFNSSHHPEGLTVKAHDHSSYDVPAILETENANKSHFHGPGTKPHEHAKANQEAKLDSDYQGDASHPQDKVTADVPNTPDDNCCKDEAARVAKTDKLAPKGLDLKFQSGSLALFNISFKPVFPVSSSIVLANNKLFVRGHHPPIPSIRIVIQSFQI
jgi:hypothetical protein